jgi:hypothetical protein
MKGAILASLALSTVICTALLLLYPEAVDFRLGNPFWNGMTGVDGLLKPAVLSSYSELPAIGYNLTLLLLGPGEEFTVGDAEAIARFIDSGGQVVLGDELGFGNSLLEKLNLPLRIDGGMVLDPLFKERNAKLPKAHYTLDSHAGEVVLNYASIIRGCNNPILQTTSYSYLDKNMNNEYDAGEEKGPFTVGCIVKLGNGELVVFSDSSLFINSMVGRGSNKELLLRIVKDRKVIVDSTHWSQTAFTTAKGIVKQALEILNGFEARYALVISAIILVARFSPAMRKPVNRIWVEQILKLNPSWDRRVLEKLAGEIRGG